MRNTTSLFVFIEIVIQSVLVWFSSAILRKPILAHLFEGHPFQIEHFEKNLHISPLLVFK